ncbi:WxL domain-containing protein [Vagococcus hydrophili]|uniref:WxL domain-containing protein n=1 Tax=Vagococcus hydrophili TaxID=2714947 RepID=A0A6G8ATH0_9ENTE|nr:WxL domain-containing protein [Vagococcus hydrophili]QIL48223.1 WxL domain-containing protein [Vagococcus hydrophili]
MKKKVMIVPLAMLLSLGVTATSVSADGGTDAVTDGRVTVEDSGKTGIVDPENPDKLVDPGELRATEGSLRFDYVSALDFGKVKIGPKNREFDSLAQNFMNKETDARGFFLQISDFREKKSGWTLQVKQEEQFKTPEYDELTGGVLSFDNGWANNQSKKGTPTVTRNTIKINNIGESYDVASAATGEGTGIWSIAFGASDKNSNNQKATLKAEKDDKGKPLMDATYNKPVYRNSAVSLSIPESTNVLPKEYQTKITWILGELP